MVSRSLVVDKESFLFYKLVNKMFTISMFDESVKSQVFQYLVTKRYQLSTEELVTDFVSQKICSKQAIYKALRELQAQNMIVWIRKYVSVNLVWLQQTVEQLSFALPNRDFSSATLPTPGKKIVIKARSLQELDAINGQIFLSLMPLLEKKDPLLFYDIHNYTYINRVSLVDWYIGHMLKYSPDIFLLVGSNSPLDTTLRKQMGSIEVYCTPHIHFKQVVAVFGNYIIYNRLDKLVQKELDQIFSESSLVTAKKKMGVLYPEKGSFKITILNNRKEAEKIKKIFKKYFLFPRR